MIPKPRVVFNAPKPVALCFGESGAETDASSEMNAAQFHSRSRKTFSSCSVMVISFHWLFWDAGREYFPLMFGGGVFLVDLGKVAATSKTLVVFAFIFGIILSEHDTVSLRLTLPVPHTIVNQSVAGCPSCIITFRRQIQRLLP